MKKGLLFFAALTSATLYAQQYVHQVLIANEGFFDFQTNAIIEPATVGSSVTVACDLSPPGASSATSGA
jgi:hypothetical protein